MKWGIFESGDLRNIALTDSEKDSLMQHRLTYVAKEFTDEQASDGLDFKKEFHLNGDEIVVSDIGLPPTNELWKEDFERWVSSSIMKITGLDFFYKKNGIVNEIEQSLNELSMLNDPNGIYMKCFCELD